MSAFDEALTSGKVYVLLFGLSIHSLFEGLGNCFKLYSLVRFNRDLFCNQIKGVWCPYEKICYCAPGWYGIECKNTKPLCNESYCSINGGTCNDLDFLQMSGCDCTGTGYHGAMCEFKDCSG